MSTLDWAKYYWTPKHKYSIDDFIKKCRPSFLTEHDAPWIWSSSGISHEDPEEQNERQTVAFGKAMTVVDDLVKRVEQIEKDNSIPTRGKKGVKSKKAVRDEAHEEAADKLKALSIGSGYTNGKWLFFPKHDNVDAVWSLIARAVACGPLKDAGVEVSKVSTTQEMDGEPRLHSICVYVNNVYDEDLMRKVLTVLLTQLGLEPAASKSDLYTMLGIDSKHPSKLRSSIFRVSDLIKGGPDAIKALRAEYKPGSEKEWKMPGKDANAKTQDQPRGGKREAPDEADPNVVAAADTGKEKQKQKPVKRAKTAAELFKENDIFAGSDEDD